MPSSESPTGAAVWNAELLDGYFAARAKKVQD